MDNTLAKEFKFFSLLKFALPSMVMMVFMSLYTMVDGMFVSRFIGTTALSAVNIVYPIYSVIIAVGIMLATGGSAVIARKMGEEKLKEAKENFSLLVLTSFILGIIIGVLCLIFLNPLLKALGANETIFEYCVSYAKTFLMFTPLALIQMLFQYFFVTAGKPEIGLSLTVIGGLLNMILDYFFIVKLEMGISGAALATGIGLAVPAIFGLIYFIVVRSGSLYIIKPRFDKGLLIESCINGSSEMVTNIAVAVVTFLFNVMMMKYLGEDGVA
ncbi:MAG: MATE family efflux transporter [Clostridium sp.]